MVELSMQNEKPLGMIYHVLAGSGTAMMTSFLFTPLDVIRVHQQNQTGLLHPAPSGFKILRDVVTNEGITKLWRGLPPQLLVAIPSMGGYFALYEYFKKGLLPHMDSSSATIVSGALARIVVACVGAPVELLKTNMQANRAVHWRHVVSNATKLSYTKLWRGLTPTLVRDVPFSSMYWWGYELLRPILYFHMSESNVALSINQKCLISDFCSGTLSGLLAAFMTTPADCVKTILQSNVGSKESTLNVARNLYHSQGWRGFFAGVGPRMAKIGPACGVNICMYEALKTFYRGFVE